MGWFAFVADNSINILLDYISLFLNSLLSITIASRFLVATGVWTDIIKAN